MQIATGLQAAHEKGVIHRDIKSANVMITTKGQIKIMDFGLAKLSDSSLLAKENSTMGTVAYMSPEQARGKKVDQRTDLWSFGVVLYEMLTGQLPFQGDHEQVLIYAIINETPAPSPTSYATIVPPTRFCKRVCRFGGRLATRGVWRSPSTIWLGSLAIAAISRQRNHFHRKRWSGISRRETNAVKRWR